MTAGPLHFIPRDEFASHFPQARRAAYDNGKTKRAPCPQLALCTEFLAEPDPENVWLVRGDHECARPRQKAEALGNATFVQLRKRLVRELPATLTWIEDQRSKRAADHTEGHVGGRGTWVDWTTREHDTEEADARRREWNSRGLGP